MVHLAPPLRWFPHRRLRLGKFGVIRLQAVGAQVAVDGGWSQHLGLLIGRTRVATPIFLSACMSKYIFVRPRKPRKCVPTYGVRTSRYVADGNRTRLGVIPGQSPLPEQIRG